MNGLDVVRDGDCGLDLRQHLLSLRLRASLTVKPEKKFVKVIVLASRSRITGGLGHQERDLLV